MNFWPLPSDSLLRGYCVLWKYYLFREDEKLFTLSSTETKVASRWWKKFLPQTSQSTENANATRQVRVVVIVIATLSSETKGSEKENSSFHCWDFSV